MEKAEISVLKDGFQLEIPNAEPITIFHQWLRDHCRCAECYNDTTNQRKLSILDFPPDIFPREYNLSDGVLDVIWDGGHRSKYQISWLVKNARFLGDNQERKITPVPWFKLPDVARVELNSYMNTDAGLSEVLSSLLRYGVAFVTGVEATLAVTEKVITRMAPVQKTFFGEMWEVHNEEIADASEVVSETDIKPHYDTAYTSIALGAHTDNTYWCDSAGLQVFHGLEPARIGGETLLVDGLNVSMQLKQRYPESYERLTRMPVSATYVEEGQHHTHVDPILKLHPVTRELLQIRFNLYDRSVLRTLPRDQIQQHYNDLRLIAAIVADKEGENRVKLSPGEVIFIDNWRVMHGRTAYSGSRLLSGGYVSRTDWRSRAAVMGLLDN
ncbi:trimethyllysine dioxygenase, mitochondrial isoform X1 [Neodiprion fabricii]|uniref:trimethyllysine dioxygenase, mitochondrial isoform X1 n=1 Tax=Neodiprion fabricii TaxID=2872261 RepID=UPI001ED96AEE|nr:trimethyllysine dioxygenase, mitochondrial isoform X1 [Neodiprion fabricii]